MAINEELTTIKIVLVEDHEIICYGLKELLSKQNDFEIIAVVSSCEQFFELPFEAHVILLDLSVGEKSHTNYIPQLKHHCPNSELLIFNASHDKETHIHALELGAAGVIYKEQSTDLICKAIRHVCLHHALWIDNALTTEMWKKHRNQTNTVNNKISLLSSLLNTTLTPKEKEVACLSAKGLSAKKIGEILFISEKTVRNKLTIIYSKLNVKGQIDLTLNKDLFDD
ncbi:MAG: LuxR C-terminal-related transcriptional regulator [Gammaproteobacteria bacterium]